MEKWLEEHQDISAEDRSRYQAQLTDMKEIVRLYEKKEGEPSEEDGKRIVALLQEMQDKGTLPEDLMKDMVPGEMPGDCGMM